MHVFEKLKPLALLWLRLALGLVFFYHGYEKLFGAPSNALQAFRHMGFPGYFVYLSGTLELFGAVLSGGGGYELILARCGASFALCAVGAGLLSVDAATFERSGGPSRSKA